MPFVDQLKSNKELSNRILVPSEWEGGIDSSGYISPKEICWFPWKKRYDSYHIEDFPDLDIHSAVDGCIYDSQKYGEVSYSLPSTPVRQMLETIDSDGYIHWDKNGVVRAEYSIVGEKWHTQQEYLIVDKELLLSRLSERHKALIWIMEELRRETSGAREKFGEFYAEKRINSIGYIRDNHFVVEEFVRNTSATKKA